jgi:hypothetical protein
MPFSSGNRNAVLWVFQGTEYVYGEKLYLIRYHCEADRIPVCTWSKVLTNTFPTRSLPMIHPHFVVWLV